MSVTINPDAFAFFFGNPVSPLGVYLEARAAAVEAKARENASGEIIGVRTGDLLRGLHSRVSSDAEGVYAAVGSDATHGVPSFAYPGWHDTHGRPWLSNAFLETGFVRR